MDLFHIVNRGVDKRTIFLDKQDHFRFIHDLFEFNNEERVNTTYVVFNKNNDIASRSIENTKPRKLLVDIHAFCLMPNHYHLLLSPRSEGAISLFIKKVDMGYAKYFNTRYKRRGALFEGRYKSVLVENESHLVYLPYYIHLNPLDLVAPEWRERRLEEFERARQFLESYRWSSFLDYIGKKNFPSLTFRENILSRMGGSEMYRYNIYEWLKELNLGSLRRVMLE